MKNFQSKGRRKTTKEDISDKTHTHISRTTPSPRAAAASAFSVWYVLFDVYFS